MPKGRPTLPLTAEQIVELERMAGLPLSQEHVAMIFGMSQDALAYRFANQKGVRDAWDRGKARAANKVLTMLWELIEGGNVAAILFYCKTQLGWRETNKLEVSGSLSIEQAIKEAFGGATPAGPPDDEDVDG